MLIKLIRYRIKPQTCDGYLSIDGLRICDTTEPTQLRVPTGTYKVIFKKHPVHNHRAPFLSPLDQSQKGKSLIANPSSLIASGPSSFLIHGNGVYHARSRDILIGDLICPGCLKCSKDKYFIPLIKRLEKIYLRDHEQVYLTISE